MKSPGLSPPSSQALALTSRCAAEWWNPHHWLSVLGMGATWRDADLDIASSEVVTAPIRYGRRSESRDNTYTMVFSLSAGPGQAQAVAFKQPIASAEDLIAEVEHLWGAEHNVAPEPSISARWGSVALLCNPDRQIPSPS